jgi:hypothetical protein
MTDTRPPLDTTFFETVQARGIALSLPLRRYFRTILATDPSSTALSELRMEGVVGRRQRLQSSSTALVCAGTIGVNASAASGPVGVC